MSRWLALLAAATCLAACGGGTTSTTSTPGQMPVTMTPAQPSGVDFTTFTEKLLTIQSDTGAPTTVTANGFVFSGNDNPAAFAAVVPAT